MIELQRVSKYYLANGQRVHALEDINLSIKQQEIFAVLGRSGAGKSTLLRCVNYLTQPSQGCVFINKQNLADLSTKALREQRHKIGMIFQHFNLLSSRTAAENIALPLALQGKNKIEIYQRVQYLLDLVELSDRQHNFPSQLSGGQKQRVAIARAIASEPVVLLCDEATSALDPESSQSILDLLKKINRELGLTILLITHELDVVKRICDRVAVLDKGKLIEQASVFDLFTKPQHSVTKQLLNANVISSKKLAFHNEILTVKLTFVGKDSNSAVISYLIKRFDITVNIQQADITQVQDKTLGYTVCQMTGESHAIKQALHYLASTSINVEVLNHV